MQVQSFCDGSFFRDVREQRHDRPGIARCLKAIWLSGTSDDHDILRIPTSIPGPWRMKALKKLDKKTLLRELSDGSGRSGTKNRREGREALWQTFVGHRRNEQERDEADILFPLVKLFAAI